MYTSRVTTTISNAADGLSTAIGMKGKLIGQILMPSAWTAAGLSFLASDEQGGTYLPVYIASTEVTMAVAASQAQAVTGTTADALAGIAWLKLRSGTASTPVQQAAARTLILMLKG
jgi:hypothetical protein